MSKNYTNIATRAKSDPSGFWGEAAAGLDWHTPWQHVLDQSRSPFNRWFVGGEINTCYNALDRHVANGRGDQVALIHDSPVTETIRHYSYAELRDQVALFAGVLHSHGVTKGDRVIIYMPAIPEAVMAMLACARIGAIHSVVFGGFASKELAVRIDDAKPAAIVSASCGIEPGRVVAYKPLLDGALKLASHQPKACIILQRPMEQAELAPGRDFDWQAEMTKAAPADCVPVAATDPLYILYTSGTTGQPKGVVRDNGGHAVVLHWSMANIYGVAPGEVFWAASDVGWVVGHSYIVYAPLLAGCTSIIYEGKPVGTPDAGAFWRVIAEHKVSVMFTAPTAIRAIKQQDPEGKCIADYDLSGFRTLFLAGERCDPDTLAWSQKSLNVPVIDHWWQTETGWPIAANCVGIELLPVRPGSPSRAVPGWDIRVLRSDGEEAERDEIGAIVCKLPLPPGMTPTLWQAEDRFVSSYFSSFEGYYETGDAGYLDQDDYVYVMARTDDIINVAGHRLSTGAMEEVIASHADVAECAVIGVADQLKGQLPFGFYVLNAGVSRPAAEIEPEIIRLVRERIGPVAAFKNALQVARLPKTRSGKILRATMQKIADNEEYKTPATIEDPAVLSEIEAALKTAGYAGG